jgi:hypothetical protein
VAAAPLSLGAGLVRIGAGRLGGPDDPLLAEFGDLAAALLGVPLRLGVAAGLVGVAVLAAGGLGRRSAR